MRLLSAAGILALIGLSSAPLHADGLVWEDATGGQGSFEWFPGLPSVVPGLPMVKPSVRATYQNKSVVGNIEAEMGPLFSSIDAEGRWVDPFGGVGKLCYEGTIFNYDPSDPIDVLRGQYKNDIGWCVLEAECEVDDGDVTARILAQMCTGLDALYIYQKDDQLLGCSLPMGRGECSVLTNLEGRLRCMGLVPIRENSGIIFECNRYPGQVYEGFLGVQISR